MFTEPLNWHLAELEDLAIHGSRAIRSYAGTVYDGTRAYKGAVAYAVGGKPRNLRSVRIDCETALTAVMFLQDVDMSRLSTFHLIVQGLSVFDINLYQIIIDKKMSEHLTSLHLAMPFCRHYYVDSMITLPSVRAGIVRHIVNHDP